MRTKITSMKRAFILFWHGLTALLTGIANWFTVILGMRDDSKYGRFLRRAVGSCFAFLMLLLAIAAGWDFCRTACYRLSLDWRSDDSYYNTQYISRSVTYYTYYDEGGYLKTSDGKKTITDIKWIAKPLGMDSLICYSDGKKRGYFNMFTGKPVIEPQYDHAWIFSDGLASVDDDGWIKFIDTSGKVVIDPKIPYMPGTDGYVFHNDLCIIHNDRRDRFGMIDKRGKWVLKPEYFSIYPSGKYWVIDNGIGIPEQEQGKVFQRFYRGTNVTDKQGFGIGLYLAREVLRKQQGYIKIKSKLNKGTTVEVFLSRSDF